jgi:hypothetical protein
VTWADTITSGCGTSPGPAVPWPDVKYPLEDHVQENKEAEAKSLAEVERVIKELSVFSTPDFHEGSVR